MKLPPQIELRHPAFFEGEDYQINFTFKNHDDFNDKFQVLQRLKTEGHIEKIMALTK